MGLFKREKEPGLTRIEKKERKEKEKLMERVSKAEGKETVQQIIARLREEKGRDKEPPRKEKKEPKTVQQIIAELREGRNTQLEKKWKEYEGARELLIDLKRMLKEFPPKNQEEQERRENEIEGAKEELNNMMEEIKLLKDDQEFYQEIEKLQKKGLMSPENAQKFIEQSEKTRKSIFSKKERSEEEVPEIKPEKETEGLADAREEVSKAFAEGNEKEDEEGEGKEVK